MTIYNTSRGDTWDSIAYNQMGDCKYTNALIRANQQYLPYYTFPAGVALVVPEVNAQRTVTKVETVAWKSRG